MTGTPQTTPVPRPGPWAVTAAITAAVSFVPFVTGVALGGCFYFRDLSSYFFPLRRFVVDGLRSGEIRHWNPYVNEGTPVLLPPAAYPLDLLQALLPGPWGLSLLLALHVPLAALTFLGLARRLGWRPAAATLGALVYALCGFSLSCLNLYVHLEALAWAPLVVWMLLRASSGARREVALAGAALALCLSTSGVEIAAQAVACAFVLSASRSPGRYLRFAASVLLGAGLAASPLLLLGGAVAGSRRGGGFSVAESLQSSVHPLSLLQTVVAGLFGDPVAAGTRYWGTPYWGGHPYVLSLYLGGAVVCLVAIGAAARGPHRGRLALLLVAGLVLALGSWARLDVLLELAPPLTRFRYPVKAFFTVVLACSLLASAAAERLLSSRRAWWALTLASTLAGVVLASLSFVEASLPGLFAALQARLFAAYYPQVLRAGALRSVADDAAIGAAVLLAVAGLGALTLLRRIPARTALVATTAIVAADLLRAGAGLNPTAPASLYSLSPEMAAVATGLRQDGGRVFTCAVDAMPTFREAQRFLGERASAWRTLVWRESLSPYANMDAAVPTTGFDATAFASTQRSLSTRETMCSEPATLQRLRAAGVRYIVSVQRFTNEELRLAAVVSPARIAPLSIFVYRLPDGLADPLVWTGPDDVDPPGHGRAVEAAAARYVEQGSDLVRLAVSTPSAAYLILRRTSAPGWTATVNGVAVSVATANGRHQAVAVPAGASDVVLRYSAPRAWAGVFVGLASAGLALGLWLPPRRSAARRPPAPPDAGAASAS